MVHGIIGKVQSAGMNVYDFYITPGEYELAAENGIGNKLLEAPGSSSKSTGVGERKSDNYPSS